MTNNIGAIILAAGKGKRMRSKSSNKVTLTLGKKQMILHTMDILNKLRIKDIVVVVGFAKESVMDVLGKKVIYAEQKKRLGTAHAVSCALHVLPKHIENVLVLNGDDSAFYEQSTVRSLITTHLSHKSDVTFLSIEVDSPKGLGRIIRDNDNKLVSIIEDKDATDKQRLIKEINPGCYVFNVSFLKRNIKKLRKNKASGEYYLTGLIDIGIKNRDNIQVIKGGKLLWRGVNTPEELEEAQRLFLNRSSKEISWK